jgi:hypothetical protein
VPKKAFALLSFHTAFEQIFLHQPCFPPSDKAEKNISIKSLKNIAR